MMLCSVVGSNILEECIVSWKMEALYSSEMLVFSYQNSLCHNSEDNSMNSHICKNLRSYKLLLRQWLILELRIFIKLSQLSLLLIEEEDNSFSTVTKPTGWKTRV